MSELSDAESEAAETQVWIEFCVKCQHLPQEEGQRLFSEYEGILRTLVGMMTYREKWVLLSDKTKEPLEVNP